MALLSVDRFPAKAPNTSTITFSDPFDSRQVVGNTFHPNNAATVYEFPRIAEEFGDTTSTLLKVSIDTNHLIRTNHSEAVVDSVHLPNVNLDDRSSIAYGSGSDSPPVVITMNSSCEELTKLNSESSIPKNGSSTKNLKAKNVKESGRLRVGRWTLDEKVLFLYGLKKFGKGRWKKISFYVPDRSLVQIKSHAQKVIKRFDAGENVFHRLEENCARLHFLVSRLHDAFGLDPVPVQSFIASSIHSSVLARKCEKVSVAGNRKRNAKSQRCTIGTSAKDITTSDGTEHIMAASALCQLALPEENSNVNETRKHSYNVNISKSDSSLLLEKHQMAISSLLDGMESLTTPNYTSTEQNNQYDKDHAHTTTNGKYITSSFWMSTECFPPN